MKIKRTLKYPLFSGMAMIGGLVTVLGGVSKTEFLASIEVLDNSPDSEAPLGRVTRCGDFSPNFGHFWEKMGIFFG